MRSSISISSLLCATGDWRCIVLKAYYDCGNKLDSRLYKTITLAGFYGPEGSWRQFDRKWGRIFKREEPHYLHTTDALALKGAYDADSTDWTHQKVATRIRKCVDAIGIAVDIGLSLISCTLFLEDYKRAKRKWSALPPPEHYCVFFCIGKAILNYYAAQQTRIIDPRIALFFDRDEPFYGHVHTLWKRKELRNTPTWGAIKQVAEVQMTAVPAIQAADLLAWSINAAHRDGSLRHDWQEPLLNMKRDKEIINAAYLNKSRSHPNFGRYNYLNCRSVRIFRE